MGNKRGLGGLAVDAGIICSREGVEGGHLWIDNFRGGGGDGRHRKYDFYHSMVTERVSILHSEEMVG